MTDVAALPRNPHLDGDEAVIRRHQRAVWRFLRWLGADAALADDLVQEAFLLLLQRPPVDRSEPAVAAWLRTTAANLFRSTGRRARAGVPIQSGDLLEAVWHENAGEDGGDGYQEALAQCLQELPARTRQALDLRYRHGLQEDALATALGLRAGGLKTLLRRARELLAQCIRAKTR
ncbi:MAG TPA: sigma-70 family RNA polymerase sigma factor [Planctomycetota bacterium]